MRIYTPQKSNTLPPQPVIEIPQCCICSEQTFVFNTECNHNICLKCITNIEQKVCPLCRHTLDNLPEKIKMLMPAYSPQQPIHIIDDDSDDSILSD